jgi:formylglycine-generating enzyme
VASVLLTAAAGCQIIAGLNDPVPGVPGVDGGDGGSGVDGTNDGGLDSPRSDGSRAPDTSTDGPSFDGVSKDTGHDSSTPLDDAGCPFVGQSMVNVGPFCIDKTEVTNSEYNDFLTSGTASLSLQPSECAFNSGYLPDGGDWTYDSTEAQLPVVLVNWCMAYAYCKWAGKHLCGAVDGGSASFGDFTASDNAHYYACSHNGDLEYPYGNSFMVGDCDDAVVQSDGGTEPSTLANAGSYPQCVGGFPGLHDMTGSVEEWQDACNGTTGAGDSCFDGTGAFDFGVAPMCSFEDDDLRGSAWPDVGFRCCYP